MLLVNCSLMTNSDDSTATAAALGGDIYKNTKKADAAAKDIYKNTKKADAATALPLTLVEETNKNTKKADATPIIMKKNNFGPLLGTVVKLWMIALLSGGTFANQIYDNSKLITYNYPRWLYIFTC